MASKLFTRFRSENIKGIAGTQEMAEEVGIALGVLALPQAGDGSLPDPASLAAALDQGSGEVETLLETLAPKAMRETFATRPGYDHLATRLRPKRRRKEGEEEGARNDPAPTAPAAQRSWTPTSASDAIETGGDLIALDGGNCGEWGSRQDNLGGVEGR